MKKRPQRLRAFSLVEVALALGVAAFCLITLIALIPSGIAANNESMQKTTAASLATAVINDLQAATNSTPTAASAASYISPLYELKIPTVGGVVGASTTSPATNLYLGNDGTPYPSASSPGALYRVSVGFNPPANSVRGATAARILVTWPAPAGGATGTWPTNYVGSFETTTAINCN